MRIIFAGTPTFALPALKALCRSSEHEVCAVYTQPDRPAGRGRQLRPSPIKAWSLEQGLTVCQPLHFRDHSTLETLRDFNAEIMVVAAYGLILPKSVLNIPERGCINVHASLLPRWRGASPIQHALMYGDKQTGITIMQMDRGMDTGDMLQQVSCDIHPTDTSESLEVRLADLATTPLLSTLKALKEGNACWTPQPNEGITYSLKIEKSFARINWHMPAEQIECQIRACTPWPIAFTVMGDVFLKIHKATVLAKEAVELSDTPGTILALNKSGMIVMTQDKPLRIEQFQFPGGRIIAVSDWLNANRKQLSIGYVFA